MNAVYTAILFIHLKNVLRSDVLFINFVYKALVLHFKTVERTNWTIYRPRYYYIVMMMIISI